MLVLSLLSSALFTPIFAYADKEKVITVPDLKSCAALMDENSYKDDFDGLKFLVQGKDGWLFRTKQDLKSEFEMKPDVVASYLTLIKVLKEKGVELVIAHAPTRGIAASEFLPDAGVLPTPYDAVKARQNYADFIKAMNDAGIYTAGTPETKAGAAYFYKTDLHWTTEGAREMAQAVADIIKTLPEYAALKKTEFEMTPAPEGEFEGNFTDAIKALCKAKMPLEKASQILIEAKAAVDQSSALFDDEKAPEVVLVGTSNSKRDDFDMNFSGSLKEFLSVDIQNSAIAGGGFDDSILAYLTSQGFQKSPAKLLIWEVPGYYNLHGDDAKKALAQLIPAVHGDCGEQALAKSTEITMGDKEAELFDSVAMESVSGKPFYLLLTIDKSVQKNFSVIAKMGVDGKQEIKFSSSRNPDNRVFYYALDGGSGAPFKDLALKSSKELIGKKISAKLCPM